MHLLPSRCEPLHGGDLWAVVSQAGWSSGCKALSTPPALALLTPLGRVNQWNCPKLSNWTEQEWHFPVNCIKDTSIWFGKLRLIWKGMIDSILTFLKISTILNKFKAEKKPLFLGRWRSLRSWMHMSRQAWVNIIRLNIDSRIKFHQVPPVQTFSSFQTAPYQVVGCQAVQWICLMRVNEDRL